MHGVKIKNGFYPPNIFPVSSLERIEGVDEKKSYLVLRSGFRIFVMLPCAELHQKIYAPNFKTDDMSMLDLSDVTGSAVAALFPRVIGAVMPDGTVYVGNIPETDKPLYTMPEDAGLAMDFNEAAQYVCSLNAANRRGHNDWRVPNTQELDMLYCNRRAGHLKGTFNDSGASYAGFYRTSIENGSDSAHTQNFKTGEKETLYWKSRSMSVRCVRSG